MKRRCPRCRKPTIPMLSFSFSTGLTKCTNCDAEVTYTSNYQRLGGIVPLVVYLIWSNSAKPEIEANVVGLIIALISGATIAAFTKLEAK